MHKITPILTYPAYFNIEEFDRLTNMEYLGALLTSEVVKCTKIYTIKMLESILVIFGY